MNIYASVSACAFAHHTSRIWFDIVLKRYFGHIYCILSTRVLFIIKTRALILFWMHHKGVEALQTFSNSIKLTGKCNSIKNQCNSKIVSRLQCEINFFFPTTTMWQNFEPIRLTIRFHLVFFFLFFFCFNWTEWSPFNCISLFKWGSILIIPHGI